MLRKEFLKYQKAFITEKKIYWKKKGTSESRKAFKVDKSFKAKEKGFL